MSKFGEEILYYCTRCGHTMKIFEGENPQEQPCTCCCTKGTEKLPVPLKYVEYVEFPNFKVPKLNKDLEQEYIDVVLRKHPAFDEPMSYFSRKEEIEAIREHNRYVDLMHSTSNKPKCPTCQSANIRKIGGVERGASIWAFGLFSKKINKTFKCKNCGYKW